MEFSTRLSSYILCIFLLIRGSDSACEVDGKTYAVGETWQQEEQHPDCFQHVCLPDGTHVTSKCDPAHNDIDEAAVETTTTITTTVPAVGGCAVDDRKVQVGEQVGVPGRCFYRACAGDNQWIMKACALIVLTPGWILTPEDVSKPYPDCCGRAAPFLDIIPDVVRGLQWRVSLKIAYDNNSVDYGNELTPTLVKAEPTVQYWAEPDSFFLLSMVDPDAPSRHNSSSGQFLHWLVGNIPGNDVSSGDILAEYVSSGPPQGTGLHRYVFLLYKQPGNITYAEPTLNNTSVEGRRNFSINEFSQNYNLSDPIALNFFVAQYDDYVPEVHKLLGILV